MRLWSLHPQYLDPTGLTACWREALLAQKVLRGLTRGYRHHPQLDRFKTRPDPAAVLAAYLEALWLEADRRGYAFDASKIGPNHDYTQIPLHEGQLLYEWTSLQARLTRRAPAWLARLGPVGFPEPHPLFTLIPGGVEAWERGT